MSIARSFRITVNLSNFFHDHRSRARIFVNEDVQRICDLEDRIKKIFNIKNFHLTSQNEFLPPCEDARILQKDDIVWVIQNEKNIEPIGTPKASYSKLEKPKIVNRKRSISDELVEEESYLPKKKNKKIHAGKEEDVCYIISSPTTTEPRKKEKTKMSDSLIVDESHLPKKNIKEVNIIKHSSSISDRIVDQPKKKKKKRKINSHHPEEIPDQLNMETESPIQQTTNNKVSTTINEAECNSSKVEVMNIDSLLPILQSHIDTYNKKVSTNQSNKKSPLNNIPISPSFTKQIISNERKQCKGNLMFYKRKVQLPTITDEYLNQKKINIVKIECFDSGQKVNSNKPKNNCETEIEKIENSCEEIQKSLDNLNMSTVDGTRDTTVLNKRLELSDIKNSTTEEISPIKTVESNEILGDNSSNSDAMFKPDEKKVVNNNIGSASKSEDKNSIIKIISSSNVQKSKSNLKMDCAQLSSQFFQESAFEKNDETAAIKHHSIKETNDIVLRTHVGSSKERLGEVVSTSHTARTLLDTNTHFKSDFQQCDNVSLKENSESYKNEYKNLYPFFSKQELVHINSATSAAKYNADDTQMEEIGSENIPEQVEPQNISEYDPLPKPDSSRISDVTTSNENGCVEGMNLSHVDHNYSDIGYAKSTGNPSSVKEPNEVDSMFENTMDSTFAMDITEPVAVEVDNVQRSEIIGKSMSKSFKRKQHTGVGQLLEDLRGNETVESIENVDSECSDFVTKRRRKRIRKRKKKNMRYVGDSSLDDSSIIMTEPPLQHKPLNTIARPSIHIKFDDDETETTTVTKDDRTSVADETYIECVSLRSDLDESKIDKVNIKDEDIVKSPSMQKMLPKVADLIAFKVLRITDNYTPEVSSYITGQVVDFDNTCKRIIFQILNGLDQCGDPKGKFSLEVDQAGETSVSDQREFIWDDLIDPRLLYP